MLEHPERQYERVLDYLGLKVCPVCRCGKKLRRVRLEMAQGALGVAMPIVATC